MNVLAILGKGRAATTRGGGIGIVKSKTTLGHGVEIIQLHTIQDF
jgi:hypothetical protein